MNNSIYFAQDRSKPVLFFVSPLCDNVITTKEDEMRTKAVLETFLRMCDNVITKENGGQKK